MNLKDLKLPVDGELGDRIVAAWLRQHIEWADTDGEERAAMLRVLEYIGGVE